MYVKEKLMNDLDKNRYLPFFMNFSARTSANQTQVSRKQQSYLDYVVKTVVIHKK